MYIQIEEYEHFRLRQFKKKNSCPYSYWTLLNKPQPQDIHNHRITIFQSEGGSMKYGFSFSRRQCVKYQRKRNVAQSNPSASYWVAYFTQSNATI